MNIQITGGGELQKWIDATTGAQARQGLNLACITEVQQLTEEHLHEIAASRHATSGALGAPPSNHWAGAADKVASASAIGSDESAGTLTINHPGIGRALHDVTIRPVSAKAIAIPVNALAYAHRPREIWDRYKLFIKRNGKGGSSNGVIMRPGPNGIAIAMYVLVRSVTQKQDRSLLPSDAEFQGAASQGARLFFIGVKAQAQSN